MRRLAEILLMLMVFCGNATAQESPIAISLDGEVFAKKFVGKPANGDKLLEFVREGESFDSWTRLIGYRYQQLPRLANDPIKYAAVMGQIVQQTNPQAKFQILKNERDKEAIIDFVTWSDGQKYIEFNVFRIWQSQDGKAVFSLQFARRFDPSKDFAPENTAEAERKRKTTTEMRHSWIKQSMNANKQQVEEALLSY